jgi:hypothetical protein
MILRHNSYHNDTLSQLIVDGDNVLSFWQSSIDMNIIDQIFNYKNMAMLYIDSYESIYSDFSKIILEHNDIKEEFIEHDMYTCTGTIIEPHDRIIVESHTNCPLCEDIRVYEEIIYEKDKEIQELKDDIEELTDTKNAYIQDLED